MPRYEDDYRGGSFRGFSMRPEPIERDSMDPNYRGGYQGMRMNPGAGGQAAYGRYRQLRERDLGGSGGFRGEEPPTRYDPRTGTYHRGGTGGYDRDYAGARERGGWHGYDPGPRRGYDRDARIVENGGVRGDNRYLRQYNSESPTLRGGGAYDRGYGRAEGSPGGGPGRGPYDRDMHQRDANRYGGYSSGGFGERWLPGPRPRGV